MLTISVTAADLGATWTYRGGSLTCGTSHLEPLRHPALEAITATDGHRTLLCVRERCTARLAAGGEVSQRVTASGFDGLTRECHTWPLEHTTIVLDAHTRTVAITAGSYGTLPLYLTTVGADRCLRASWQLPDLHSGNVAGPLDLVSAAGLLTRRRRYDRHTLFQDTWMLTERATATFGDRGLTLTYPEPAEHGLPRDLATGIDPVAVLDTLLADACRSRPLPPSGVAVQLSGGIDSASVALTLGRLHHGQVTPAAMLIGGMAGPQQTSRRAQMIDAMRLGRDTTIKADAYLPFAPGTLRAQRPLIAGPDEEPYLEMADALATSVAARGATVVLTGFGGDEFSAPHQPKPTRRQGTLGTRRPPGWTTQLTWEAAQEAVTRAAPSSRVHRTTLQALACADPLQVRRGLWPIHPFTDQQVIRFGEWLPDYWRHHKHLQRHRLGTVLSHRVVHPPLRENFGHLMTQAIHQHLAPRLLAQLPDLRLAHAGLVDPDQLREAARAAADHPKAAEHAWDLYAVVALESYVRALEEQAAHR